MVNKPIMVRMTKQLRDKAEHLANEKGVSLSELIRLLLIKEIDINTNDKLQNDTK